MHNRTQRTTWLKAAPTGLVVALFGSTAAAGSPASRLIDPELRAGPRAAPADTELAAVLRLPALTPALRARLEREGIRFRRRADGSLRHVGALYPVDATQAALARRAQEGDWVRLDRKLGFAPSLEETGSLTQAFDLWGVGPTPTQGVLGERLTLGLMDSGIDVFHPHFFRADGGAWAWFDVDGDGVLTPGTDGIDLDGDGQIGAGERLRLLDYYVQPPFTSGGEGDFDVQRDYLYLDVNDSGERERGPAGGFSEAAPGYGEPMYLPDNADGNETLDPDERLLLLKTSQIKAVRAGHSDDIWLRGVDLIRADLPSPAHGTSSAGTMTGGQTHPFRINRGLVPDADIVMVTFPDLDGQDVTANDLVPYVESYAWLVQDMAVSVINNSWGIRSNRTHRDGSSVVDLMIDEATSLGVTQACAAGNGQDKGRHRSATLPPDTTVQFDSALPGSGFHSITFDIHWRDPSVELQCSIQRPDGATQIVEEGPDGAFDGLVIDAVRSDSERGTALFSIATSSLDGSPLEAGSWVYRCSHNGTEPLVAHAFVYDNVTYSYPPGAAFSEPTPSHNVISPALSDTCIAVAGYVHFFNPPEGPLTIAPFSSHGPRIDETPIVDITAPIGAITPTATSSTQPNRYGAFNGTSAAAPHVAAVAALMKIAQPDLDPLEIRELMHEGANSEGLIGPPESPNAVWGHGTLRGYNALLGMDPPPRPSPTTIETDVDYESDDDGCAVTVTVSDADWPGATLRWDVDYDGTWDTDFAAETSHTVVVAAGVEDFVVRIDAAQDGWIIAGETVSVEVPASCYDGPDSDDGGTEGDTNDTGDTSGSTTGSTTDGGDGTTGGGDGATGGDNGATGTDGPGSNVDGEDDGCSCQQGAPPSSMLAAGFLVVLLRRRRPGAPRPTSSTREPSSNTAAP